ncbi:MAG: flippase-like domain-containing protein [Saprospiraceae bacterium]|nr:flippase-like domain-containing protein [Saprospiraceae bacterium]
MDSVRFSKIGIPVLLGLAVVVWMMFRQLDVDELLKLDKSGHTIFWISMAVFMYILRHFFYAWRLKIITDNAFSWRKSVELIFIWEFSSAVSPTSVGGAGVALFLLAQEKISGAKTVSVVLYSMVLDTLFFVVSLPLLYILIGPVIIRPGMESILDLDGFGYTFITVLGLMVGYGTIFYYGLFINPRSIKRLLLLLSRIGFLKKFKNDLRKTAMDVVVTSEEMKTKNKRFHINSMLVTSGAWITRFFAINCLILALVANISPDIYDHLIILGRGEAMHAITSFSPTPGGAGIAEYLFGGFFSDYIPAGIASLIALVWRLISYYPYLIAGVIIIPNWFNKILERRKREKAASMDYPTISSEDKTATIL